VREFHEGEDAWMLDQDVAQVELAMKGGKMKKPAGSIPGMRVHVESVEDAVEGLVVWAGMLEDVDEKERDTE
jgi:hypothetical protein